MKNKHQKILKKAAHKLGYENSLDKCIEECSELIHELVKLKKGTSNKNRTISEMADVELTMTKLRLFIDKNGEKYRNSLKSSFRRLNDYLEKTA